VLDPTMWYDCESYLYGVDLFNHAYWWEAHEAWEGPWRAAGRQSATGFFLQGLIQISVARLKWSQTLIRPAQRLSRDGRAKLALNKGRFAGLEISGFGAHVSTFFDVRKSQSERQLPLVITLE
jgi:hypothetical protein